jgi:hypothetical protein
MPTRSLFPRWGSNAPGQRTEEWFLNDREEETMKILILATVLSVLVGSQALADGPSSRPNSGTVNYVEHLGMEGINCLVQLGWSASNSHSVPREDSAETQLAVGRCLGIFDSAVFYSKNHIPEEVYEQQLGLYLVTLKPTLVAYSVCLAERCDQLEEIIDRDAFDMAVRIHYVPLAYLMSGS